MKRFSPETYLLAIIFCSIFTFLGGCSNSLDNDETKEVVPTFGGNYRISLFSNPVTLDPAYVQDQYSMVIVKQLFDGLVRYDSSLTLLPALAEEWQIGEEGRVYRFKLRKNAKFHDGSPIEAEDISFSISRLLRVDPAPPLLPHLLKIKGAEEYRGGEKDELSGLEILSNHELNIHLSESHVPFLSALGMYQASIVPKHIVEKEGEIFAQKPVGSGPFRFKAWQANQYINLERFDDYYSDVSYIDEIRFKIYIGGPMDEILSDFQNGELEDIGVFGDFKEKLANIKGLQWFHRPSLSLFFYGMNCRHPVLSDPNVRNALSACINRNSFVSEVYDGKFDVARTILPPGMPGYNPAQNIPDGDVELAKQLMEKYRGDKKRKLIELELVSAFQSPRVEKEMELMKKYWARIGVSLQVKYITDWPKFEAYIKSDNVQIFRYVWFADMPDPDSILYPLFASNSPNNFMKYRDTELDQMLLSARAIVDPVRRADMYHTTESSLMDSLPLVPLFHLSVDRVYQPYVRSVSVSALGAHAMQLNKIWLDRPAAE